MPISRIKTDGIQDDAVTSAKIGTSVIIADDLAANSVTVSEIQDDAVTTAKLSGLTNASSGIIQADGDGTLSVTTADLVDDTTPQLGGNLDLNSNDITGTGNIDITGTLGVSGLITASSGVAIGGTGSDNTLDDYEEGTWTPALQTGIPGSPAASVSSANCRYVKIGGLVQASAYFLAANDGTNIQIGGLPFTINKYSSFSMGHQNRTVSFERMDNGNAHVNFTLSGTNTSLQEWYFSIQYYTTS